MLYILGKRGEAIMSDRLYCVWDSDDFVAEAVSGNDIQKAYKGGIKFANIGKQRKSSAIMVSRRKLDMSSFYTNNTLETSKIYCVRDYDEFNGERYLLHYNDTLYCCYSQLYRLSEKINHIPALVSGRGYVILDTDGRKIVPAYNCKITRSGLKRVLLLEGLDYVFDTLGDDD